MKVSEQKFFEFLDINNGKREGKGYKALCPAHGDRNRSLSVNRGNDGTLLVNCYSQGCDFNKIITASKDKGWNPDDNNKTIHAAFSNRAEKNETTDSHLTAAAQAQVKFKGHRKSASVGYLQRKLNAEIDVYNDVTYIGQCETFYLQNIDGEITGYQQIYNRARDNKRNLTGMKKEGSFYPIGDYQSSDEIILVEGIATGHSVARSLDRVVVCAMDVKNIESVVKAFQHKYPQKKIIIAADNDHAKERNAGLSEAKDLSARYGVQYFHPPSEANIKDFNDLEIIKGKDAVMTEFENLKQEMTIQAAGSTNAQTEWGEVIPLDNFKPMYGKTLDIRTLPFLIQEYVKDISERLGVAPEMPAVLVLAVFANIIGRAIGIKPKKFDDSWKIVPRLWTLIVADSGQKKTPTLNTVLQLLEDIEQNLHQLNTKNYTAWKAEHDVVETEAKLLKGKAKKLSEKLRTHESEAQISELLTKAANSVQVSLAKQPKKFRIKTNDCTPEKFLEILSDNELGILIVRDEIAGLIKGFEAKGREQERSTLLEAFNGDGNFQQDRIGRGNTNVSGMRAGVIGSIQNDILAAILRDKKVLLSEDGFLYRFQLAIVPSPSTNFPMDRQKNEAAFKVVEEKANAIFEKTFKLSLNGNLKANRAIVSFDSDAQEIFSKWCNDLQTELKFSDLGQKVKQHLSKYESLLAEICLVFHVMDSDLVNDLSFKPINKFTLEKAIEFVSFLRGHAMIILSLMDNKDKSLESMLAKVISGEITDGMLVREIKRKQWANLTTDEQVDDVLKILEDHNYLRIEKVKHVSGRPKSIVNLNPKLALSKLTKAIEADLIEANGGV